MAEKTDVEQGRECIAAIANRPEAFAISAEAAALMHAFLHAVDEQAEALRKMTELATRRADDYGKLENELEVAEQQNAVLTEAAREMYHDIIGCTGPDSFLREVIATHKAKLTEAGITL